MSEAQVTEPDAEPLVFAPGARVVVRDEEWIVKTTRQASGGAIAVERETQRGVRRRCN